MYTTQHFHLFLFEDADKPTWLYDWNETMYRIDEALYTISGGSGDIPDLTDLIRRVQVLETNLAADETRITALEEGESGILTSIQTINDTIQTISSSLSDLDTYSHGVGSDLAALTTTVSSMATTISSLSDRVTALENAPGGMPIFIGTTTEWNNLTSQQKAEYVEAHFTDDNTQ